MADTLAVVVLSKEAQNARYLPLRSAKKNIVARFYALILLVGARGRYFSLFIILIYMKANVVDLDIESRKKSHFHPKNPAHVKPEKRNSESAGLNYKARHSE